MTTNRPLPTRSFAVLRIGSLVADPVRTNTMITQHVVSSSRPATIGQVPTVAARSPRVAGGNDEHR